MDRKTLKAQARESLADTGRESKIVTLIFLLCAVATVVLRLVFVEVLGNLDTGGSYLSDSVVGASKSMVVSYGIAIVFQMLLVLLCAGYAAAALEWRHKNPVAAGTLLAGFRLAGRVLLVYVLMMLFVSLWAYAFSMPLSYFLIMDAYLEEPMLSDDLVMVIMVVYIGIVMFLTTYRYRTAFFMLMDDPSLAPRQALRQATAINKGHRIQLFLMDLSFLPWILLGVLTCGVLLVWKLPYIITTYACAYDAMMADYAQRQIRLREMQEQMMKERFEHPER